MAYGLKYYFEDKKIVTSTTVTYRFEILEDAYAGSSTEWTGVSIQRQYEESSLRDIKSIQKGSVSGVVIVEDATQRGVIESIAGSQIGDYKVQLKKDGTVIWTGYVVPDLISISEENYNNQTASIVAKDLLFTGDFTLATGDEKAIVIIADILDTLGYGLNITSFTSWTDTTLTTTDDILNQAYHKKERLRTFALTDNDEDRPITNEQALEYLLNTYGLILRQANGSWNLIQISAFETTSAVRRYIYNSSGTQTSSETDYQLGATLAQGDLKLFGSTANNYYAGVKKVKSRFDHKTNIQGIKLNREYWITDGSDIVKSQFIQSDGTGNIELFFVTWFAKTTAIDLGNPNVLDVQIYVDTNTTDYYWNGSDWQTTPTTIDIDVEETYSTTDSDGNYVHKNNGVSIVTSGIPDGSDGTLYVKFITDELQTNYAYWYFRSIDLKISYSDQVGGVSEGIDYELEQTGAYSHIYDYGTYYYGGGPTTGAVSALRDSSGNLLSSWKRSTDASTTSHAELLLRERLDIMRGQRRNMRSILYGEYEPDKALNYDSTVFFFLGGSWDSTTYQWSANFIELDVDTANDDDFNIFYITQGEGTTSGAVGSLSTSTGSGSIYLEKSKNLQDVTSASTARTNLGLGTTSDVDFGQITGSSFVKEGGTSSQFLKADGSVDSTTYLTQSTADNLYDDYNYFSVTDGSSTFNVGSQQTMSITASGNSQVTYDTETRSINITSTDTNTDTNYYLSAVNWDDTTGDLTFTVTGGTNLTTNIDGRYLTSLPSHNHNDLYYTETELNGGQLDNRYYTESEINTFLSQKDNYSSWTVSDTVNEENVTSGFTLEFEGTGGIDVSYSTSTNRITIDGAGAGGGDITAVNTATNSGLSGGVTSGDADLSLNINNLATLSASQGNESLAILDGTTTKKILLGNIALSHFNDDLDYVDSTTISTTYVSKSAPAVGADLDMNSNTITEVESIILVNKEGENFNTTSGRLMFDENFYGDTEYGSADVWTTNGGGLIIRNEDGWGRILSDKNMEYLNASFASITSSGNIEVQGITAQTNTNPKIQLIETDGNADENVELMLSGGDFFIRTLNDDGTNPANENLFKVNHEGVVTLMAQGSTTSTSLNALFQDASGNLKRRTLGSLAYSSATYDNYSSWSISDDGTATTTAIGSGDNLNIVGGTGITAVLTSANTLTISATNNGDITAVTAGTGLSGGGTSGSVTLALDFSELADMTADVSGTTELILQNGTTESRKAISEVKLSAFNNDLGWTSNAGDITAVSAGTGLTGGGTSGSVTLSHGETSTLEGTYGSTTDGTKVDSITVDAFGHVTAISTGATGDITGVTAGSGLTGGGTSGTVTVSHADTSSQASVNNSNGSVIQDVTLDTYGHVTGLVSADLDDRYLTLSGGSLTGNLTIGGTATPTIFFNGTSDTGIDMAIKATPEGIDIYEPEDGNKIHFRVYDDSGVDAPFGYWINGTRILDSSRQLSNVTYGGNTIFHDGYHPNADTLTTARTISLGGDLSGSASFNGSSNITISATVTNDSHTHDGRYYTETESDSRFVNVTGDSMSGDLTITGTLSATVKSFDIEHPTQEGKRLVYGVLEGPEHAVFFRGRSNSKYIQLPEEWTGLIDPETITVQLTPANKPKTYFYKGYKDNKIEVGASGWNWKYDYFYLVHATRVDVEQLQTVQDAN